VRIDEQPWLSDLDGTAAASSPEATRAPRPAVQRGSSRGLTTPGVILVVLAASVLGAVVDTIIGDDLRAFFAVFFVASAIAAAAVVRRRDSLAAIIAPPLVFLAIVGAHEVATPTGKSRALIDLSGDLLSAMALKAPELWAGTVAAAVIVLVRYRRSAPKR
jgi:hypothetical protein